MSHVDGLMFSYDLAPRARVPSQLGADEVQSVFGAAEARYLNRGAYAEAWAIELDGGVRVAKILERGAPSRILREITALKSVESPHVVSLHDMQLVHLGGRQRVALIFDFVDGEDLDARLRAARWPSAGEATACAQGMAAGLAALHAAGGVHRDVKPGNVALRGGSYSQPVLLDLGLVRLVDLESITTYPAAVGTPAFMSPQIVRGERADSADDMWSLGVVLYLLLERRHPLYGPLAEAVEADEALVRMTSGPKPLGADTPAPVRDLVRSLLAPDRGGRPSAAAAAAALGIANELK